MDDNNVIKTEPIQKTHKKIGKHLRATHYKLGRDGNLKYLILYLF